MATARRTLSLSWALGLAPAPQAPLALMPRPPRALLRIDVVTITRSRGTTVDAEGDESGGRWVVLNGRGTLSAVTTTEVQLAAQRGSVVDKALNVELGTDLLEGDWVTVKGTTYEVVDAADLRLQRRALVRKLP